jgi:hypothetical protein
MGGPPRRFIPGLSDTITMTSAPARRPFLLQRLHSFLKYLFAAIEDAPE